MRTLTVPHGHAAQSYDEEKGENGHVAGADIRSDQQYATGCRQATPCDSRVGAACQRAPDDDVERHGDSWSNNDSICMWPVLVGVATAAR